MMMGQKEPSEASIPRMAIIKQWAWSLEDGVAP